MPVPRPPALTVVAVVRRLRQAGCVFAEDEAALLMDAARSGADLLELLERRTAGEPLEHLVGWAEFCGRRIAVDPGVFVPRRRTELLVRTAAALVRGDAASDAGRRTPPVLVDLCCGSGAIGAALAARLGRAELYAADVDPTAVRCAQRNLLPLRGRVLAGDLFEPLPLELRGRVDVIAANVPYVPTASIGSMPPEARDHEPRTALDGGPDGLDVLRRVVAEAPRWLASGGSLLFETSARQAAEALHLVAAGGLVPSVTRDDTIGATVLVATRPTG